MTWLVEPFDTIIVLTLSAFLKLGDILRLSMVPLSSPINSMG